MKTFKTTSLIPMPVRGLGVLEVSFLFMELFKIKSPSGKEMRIWASTIYHACQLAVHNEGYKFSNVEYLKLNK